MGGEQSPPVFVGELPPGSELHSHKINRASFGQFGDIDEMPAARAGRPKPSDGGFKVALPESPLLNNLSAKIKRQAAKEFVAGSLAQYPSPKQVGYLGFLLDNPGRAAMTAFVRFANGYYAGEITRVHFVEAIELAKNGRNSYGTANGLVRLASGEPEEDCLMPWDRRPSRQRKPKASPVPLPQPF
jgi:hypothetical protein